MYWNLYADYMSMNMSERLIETWDVLKSPNLPTLNIFALD